MHRRTTALAGIVLLLSLQTAAQNVTIPDSWREPTSNMSRQDRLSLVSGLLSTIVPTLNVDTGLFDGLNPYQLSESASMSNALSTGDYINGSTTNKDVVLRSLNTMFTKIPNITSYSNPVQENRDPATWGLAAISAYRTYKDPSSLQYAQSIWKQLVAFLVTPENAANGTHPMRNISIPATCNGATTAGAVFSFSTNPSELDVGGVAVTTFMTLSARLYEETSDSQYMSSASLSADFIINQLYNGVIIQNNINLGNCETSLGPYTYNSGLAIDGLSSLAAANSSYATVLSNLVSGSILYPAWTNSSNGILTEGPGDPSIAATSDDFTYTLKPIFIRGLYEAYRRLPTNSSEAAFIHKYLTIQFNALVGLASISGSNVYSPRWQGPPISSLNPTGQLAALDVLNSAVGLAAPISSSRHHRVSRAVIGVVVAVVVVVVILVPLIAWLCIRRHRNAKDLSKTQLEATARPYPLTKPEETGSTQQFSPTLKQWPQPVDVQEVQTTNNVPTLTTLSEHPETNSNANTSAGDSSGERHMIVSLAQLQRAIISVLPQAAAPVPQHVVEEPPPRYED